MNLMNRMMSYDKSKNIIQESCECEECTNSKTENQTVEYPPLSEEEIEQIINERYSYKDEKTKTFIRKALRKHGDRYNYSKAVYVKALEKVKIDCRNEEHPTFEQTPHDHLSGKGCARCGGKKKLTTEEFIEKARKIFGNLYDYSKVKYINACTEIEIICSIHGSFWQTPNEHLSGYGCFLCAHERIGKMKRLTLEEFIEKARKIHGNKYNYSKVKYINSHTEIIIICPKHGEFTQVPTSHLSGNGCPKCKASKGEIEIRNFLINHDIEFEEQKRFENCKYKYRLPFDFYLPLYNLCIEFDGEQHFRPCAFGSKITEEEKLENFKIIQFRDKIKNNFCKNNNINFLRIRYNKNINEELINYFQNNLELKN